MAKLFLLSVGGAGHAVVGREGLVTTPWLTERHGYDPTLNFHLFFDTYSSVRIILLSPIKKSLFISFMNGIFLLKP